MIDLRDLGPLYHDYSVFGARSEQLPGIFGPNQRAKAPILCAYILHAIALCGRAPSFVELFCADGFYAMFAARFGASAVGVDDYSQFGSDGVPFTKTGAKVASRLGLSVDFRNKDALAETDQFDIVANVGGLYHVKEPREYLQHSADISKRFLIVQSVVSMENEDPDYFVSPPKGQDWGNRMSVPSFSKMVHSIEGFRVRDSHFNQLEGNDQPKDRGSVYYFLERLPPFDMDTP